MGGWGHEQAAIAETLLSIMITVNCGFVPSSNNTMAEPIVPIRELVAVHNIDTGRYLVVSQHIPQPIPVFEKPGDLLLPNPYWLWEKTNVGEDNFVFHNTVSNEYLTHHTRAGVVDLHHQIGPDAVWTIKPAGGAAHSIFTAPIQPGSPTLFDEGGKPVLPPTGVPHPHIQKYEFLPVHIPPPGPVRG